MIVDKWFKVPKKLLTNRNYIKLSVYAKIMLLNLISLDNSYKGKWFHQSNADLSKFLNITDYQIRIAKKELKEFGVEIKRIKNDHYFNLKKVLEQ